MKATHLQSTVIAGVCLVILLALASACNRTSPPAPSSPTPQVNLRFKVNDGVDDGEEGLDSISVTIVEGFTEEVTLHLSSDAGETYTDYPLTDQGGQFSTNLPFAATTLNWYISARGIGASTTHGSYSAPLRSEKYLTKDRADALIEGRVRELLSSGVVGRYDRDIDVNLQDAELTMLTLRADHDADLLSPTDQFAKYLIAYSTERDSDTTGLSRYAVRTYTPDTGFVIIHSTHREGLLSRLVDTRLFPGKSGNQVLFEY